MITSKTQARYKLLFKLNYINRIIKDLNLFNGFDIIRSLILQSPIIIELRHVKKLAPPRTISQTPASFPAPMTPQLKRRHLSRDYP